VKDKKQFLTELGSFWLNKLFILLMKF